MLFFLPLLSDATPPTAPRSLKVEVVDEQSIKVSWKAPKSDGGAPLTGYILEMRGHTNKDSMLLAWKPPKVKGQVGYVVEVRGPEDEEFHVLEVLAPEQTSYTVHGLMEMVDYEFRVKATNAVGTSKKSAASKEPVKTKEGSPAKGGW